MEQSSLFCSLFPVPCPLLRIGTAGWSYKDWAGIVYPAPKPRGFDPLPYLASYFDVIEINTTFYRPATKKNALAWVERVKGEADFRFTAKLYRRFTHERARAWTRAEVREARVAFDVMRDADRLGAVLLQFPWSFRNSEESREWLGDLITTFSELPLVVEVRHDSWAEPEFFRELVGQGVGFVNIDQPLFKDSIEPSARVTSRVGYVRVHGRNYQDWWRDKAQPHERYDYLYTPKQLEPWVERIEEIAEETEESYVVLNNHYKGQAPANALMIKSMVAGKKVAAPPSLMTEFPTELATFADPVEAEPAAAS